MRKAALERRNSGRARKAAETEAPWIAFDQITIDQMAIDRVRTAVARATAPWTSPSTRAGAQDRREVLLSR